MRGTMKQRLIISLLTVTLSAIAAPAFADVTAFIGANTTPSNRVVRGFAGGIGVLIIGFEFEYSDTVGDEVRAAPSLRTGMGNLLLQTPGTLGGVQLYGTVGAGLYRERLGTIQETHVGVNVGGGAKLVLLGPLRLRLDYRLFTLQGQPLHPRPQRIYAGLNLAF
jgi:hypothetical protein